MVQKTIKRDRKAESTFRYNLKLKDDKFVGQFTENKDGSFTIRDIRRSDFRNLYYRTVKSRHLLYTILICLSQKRSILRILLDFKWREGELCLSV